MCTCITYENGDIYFGRNLDLEDSFGEKVAITPRNYPFRFCCEGEIKQHYAMIGMASMASGYPLYAEAVNEKGLGMAGLNFPGNACYKKEEEGKKNIASFEVIPWILGNCASVHEAEKLLRKVNITNHSFSEMLPPAPLHWMLADQEQCLVLEPTADGLKIYANPYGVLTNNPPFPFHEMNLQGYLNLTAETPENRFAKELDFKVYGQGMGAIGLPGDASPASRFVKATFLKWNSVAPQEETASVAQFFHILEQVAMVRGSVWTEKGQSDMTTYTCCVNLRTGAYYYRTYENSRIHGVLLREEDLEGCQVIFYELEKQSEIHYVNRRRK